MDEPLISLWPEATKYFDNTGKPTDNRIVWKAWAWKVGAFYLHDMPYITVPIEALFPMPTQIETVYDVRCLMTKMLIGDYLLPDFRWGVQVDHYYRLDGTPVYDNNTEAMKQLVEAMRLAHKLCGTQMLYELHAELVELLVSPL